jgi:hypothetical protein
MRDGRRVPLHHLVIVITLTPMLAAIADNVSIWRRDSSHATNCAGVRGEETRCKDDTLGTLGRCGIALVCDNRKK